MTVAPDRVVAGAGDQAQGELGRTRPLRCAVDQTGVGFSCSPASFRLSTTTKFHVTISRTPGTSVTGFVQYG
jgi:hypothetical protein